MKWFSFSTLLRFYVAFFFFIFIPHSFWARYWGRFAFCYGIRINKWMRWRWSIFFTPYLKIQRSRSFTILILIFLISSQKKENIPTCNHASHASHQVFFNHVQDWILNIAVSLCVECNDGVRYYLLSFIAPHQPISSLAQNISIWKYKYSHTFILASFSIAPRPLAQLAFVHIQTVVSTWVSVIMFQVKCVRNL